MIRRETNQHSGIVVSFFTGGAFCGSGLAGPIGDKFGRRWTIFAGCILFILGGGLQTGAQHIHYLWAGRWIAGLGGKPSNPWSLALRAHN